MADTQTDEVDQTYPLKYVQEVLSWYPARAGRKASPLQERGPSYRLKKVEDEKEVSFDLVKNKAKCPQIMVCHDMRGGYLEDRYFDGCSDIPDEPYRFVHWAMIDSWIYFSHHFVTIPPLGWIEAAHANGVKVLGTIITEWDNGEALCNQFLADDPTMRKFAAKCAQIAHDVGFEGWLLNIENRLESDLVPKMKEFVKTLTEEMHRLIPSSLVIWYDSVTLEGKLKWQNELNSQNYPFFELCDGIFLNYNWRVDAEVDSIINSLQTLKDNNAPERHLDIYFGTDVFGRGTYGGGGFNSCKAFEALKGRTSMAIFAPGWTHECKGEEGGTCSNFVDREYKFWNLIQPHADFKAKKLLTTTTKSQLTFHNGVEKHSSSKWSLDYRQQNFMPPVYDLEDGGPYLLCHHLDLTESSPKVPILLPENGGMAVAKRTKPCTWLGIPNIVPLVLCQVDVHETDWILVKTLMDFPVDEGMKVSDGSDGPKIPALYGRFYEPENEDPVVERLENFATKILPSSEKDQITIETEYCLSFKTKRASFLDCLAIEMTLTYPQHVVLRQCTIEKCKS